MGNRTGDVWVYIETDSQGTLLAGSELLAPAGKLARDMGAGLTAFTVSTDCNAAVLEAATCGADRIVCVTSSDYDQYNTEANMGDIAGMVEKYAPAVVMFTGTGVGRDLATRLAARADAGLVADCVSFKWDDAEGHVVWTRMAFGGSYLAEAVIKSGMQVATIHPNTFRREENAAGSGTEVVNEEHYSGSIRATIAGIMDDATDKGVNIEDAEILVAGGLGMKGEEGFALLQQLADLLGGTIAASRAATDAGWISTTYLVGQTGKIVAPKVYIACGISGAIQHVCGMSDSDYIIAINKDEYAPIFDIADVGIVGDAFKIIPALIEEIKAERQK